MDLELYDSAAEVLVQPRGKERRMSVFWHMYLLFRAICYG